MDGHQLMFSFKPMIDVPEWSKIRVSNPEAYSAIGRKILPDFNKRAVSSSRPTCWPEMETERDTCLLARETNKS